MPRWNFREGALKGSMGKGLKSISAVKTANTLLYCHIGVCNSLSLETLMCVTGMLALLRELGLA